LAVSLRLGTANCKFLRHHRIVRKGKCDIYLNALPQCLIPEDEPYAGCAAAQERAGVALAEPRELKTLLAPYLAD
jgi:hypothetical protein